MYLRLGKTALRLLVALTLGVAFGLQQAYAATWSTPLNCPFGGDATVSFDGISPTNQPGKATYTYTVCSRNYGCGTQVDSQQLASGHQFYHDSFQPNSAAYVTSIQVNFNGTFYNTPYAVC